MKRTDIAMTLGMFGGLILVPSLPLLLKGLKRFPSDVEAMWSVIGLAGCAVAGLLILIAIGLALQNDPPGNHGRK